MIQSNKKTNMLILNKNWLLSANCFLQENFALVHFYATKPLIFLISIKFPIKWVIIRFQKIADSVYFGHNGGQNTMSRKRKVDFFKSLGIIFIISEVSLHYRKVHTGRQLAPRVNKAVWENESFNYRLKSIFFIWVFFHNHSRITGLQGKEEGISLIRRYYFHPLHRHLDISWAITAEGSPLHIGSSRTRTGNLWFPSASR